MERAPPSLQAVPRPAPCRNALSSGTESTRRTGMCLDEHIWDALAHCGSEASQVGVAAPPRPPRRHVTPSPATGPQTQAPGAVTIATCLPERAGPWGVHAHTCTCDRCVQVHAQPRLYSRGVWGLGGVPRWLAGQGEVGPSRMLSAWRRLCRVVGETDCAYARDKHAWQSSGV